MEQMAVVAGESASKDGSIGRREGLAVSAYAVALVWINVYVCRELFLYEAAHMNSMHGFWIALAKRAGDGWFHANWWPYWNLGMPSEFAYAPLVPTLTAAIAAIRGIPHTVAFQSVTGLVYCAVPLTLFLMAWRLTRAPGYSFLAGLFYSLTASTQLIVPDAAFSFHSFWEARRLYIAAVWDETPHLAALALLPLAILFLAYSIRRRKPIYYAAAVFSIALMTLASDFGPVMTMMAALCLLFVLRRQDYWRNIGLTVGIGALAYAIAMPSLPPSLILAIHQASGAGWTMGSVTAIALVAVGWVILWRYLPRWTTDWRLQFFALFAYLTSSVPILGTYLHREFIPQPNRYKLEMELALALVLVFGARVWVAKASRPLKAALLLLFLALAGEQIVSHRKFAKIILRYEDPARTIEYRASLWAERNLGDVRVMLPGSIGQWANAFTGLPQLSGGSWSVATNPVQQTGLRAIWNGGDTPERDAEVSLAWLKAYGVRAIAVSGPASKEFWKPYAHPLKFEGVLPVLWREDDVTIYQVPLRTESLAHVLPAAAIVSRAPTGPGDIAPLEQYVAALDDPALPAAAFQWQGSNRIRIAATASRGQAISVQVSYHPGWHATVAGRDCPLKADALGLMWLTPECSGPCEVQLDYNGGWELRLSRLMRYAALAALLAIPFVKRRRGAES